MRRLRVAGESLPVVKSIHKTVNFGLFGPDLNATILRIVLT
jgi:hypothetical protein